MSILEISIVHHIALVLAAVWALGSLGWLHPVVFFCALVYLYAVLVLLSFKLFLV
jgi:hypothetical protein